MGDKFKRFIKWWFSDLHLWLIGGLFGLGVQQLLIYWGLI